MLAWKRNKYYIFWVCVCSLSYPACNAPAHYGHLSPVWLNHISSSSLGTTTSIFECFGPLNIRFPLITILDAANPTLYFQFLTSSSHLFFGLPCGRIDIGLHLILFFTILSSGIRRKCPKQLNRCALCDLLHSHVLLTHPIHRLFWFSMYHVFLL